MYNFYDWLAYECELICAFEHVYRKTDKFIYTVEIVQYKMYYYRINWRPGPGERFFSSYDCTMYKTYEEAEKEAKADTRGRKWTITRETYETETKIDHRYKRV